MEHVPNSRRHCVVCGVSYEPEDALPCRGPHEFGAPDEIKRQAFAEKIKTLSIHPKGRS